MGASPLTLSSTWTRFQFNSPGHPKKPTTLLETDLDVGLGIRLDQTLVRDSPPFRSLSEHQETRYASLKYISKAPKKDSDIEPDELAHYANIPNIRVRFQKKAWADEGVILDYMHDFREDTEGLGEVILGMDRHGSQKTPLVREFMSWVGIFPLYTPPECTDVVSPCDHHIGRHLQVLLAERYEEAYDANQMAWDMNGIETPEKRMLFATWASEAWTDLCTNNKHLIHNAFVETGFLLARDGSENELIKLQNWNADEPYDF